jgi:hypothetical protein
MATFLVTSKMDPALAERIEASVRQLPRAPSSNLGKFGPRARRGALSPRLVAMARLTFVVTVALAIVLMVVARRRSARELESARAALTQKVRAESGSLTPAERNLVPRLEPWLRAAAGPYEGDVVAEELRQAPGALGSTLTSRPLVYMRGPLESFGSSHSIAMASASSYKDALLLCLVEPLPSRAEKPMLDKVRIAASGGANMENRTSNVRRLNDGVVGLPFLQPEWALRITSANEPRELETLRQSFERAPIERAKQAAKAELLLIAVDEPGDRTGPTELDGERTHFVRLVLVDLPSSRVMLRSRKLVDPSWVSLAKKSAYAGGLDGCGLALDVHEQVTGKPTPK